MEKIVFVCGMSGGKRDMSLMKRVLKEPEMHYFHYDTSLADRIEVSARKLAEFVRTLGLKKNERIGIIALSAGGIISEYYLKFIDSSKVSRIVTVCSPFGGTWFPSIFSKKRKGLHELKQGSSLLKRLKHRKLEDVLEKNYWCYCDPLVPGVSARGANPEHTLFFMHWLVQFWPPIVFSAKRFLLSGQN